MQHPNTFKLAVSLRVILARLVLSVFILGALALLLMSLKQEGFSKTIRGKAEEWLTPITSIFSTPVAMSKTGIESVDHYVSVREDNERLRKENKALLLWQQRAKALAEENDALRKVSKARNITDLSYATALVTAMDGGPYREAVKLNLGAQDGIKAGLAVINEAGFIGRIIEVRENVSWMLLLHDVNSRIPVRNTRNDERAILLGGRGKALRLSFLSKEADFKTGDLIITAADGGVLPDGLPVGTVNNTGKSPILTPHLTSSRLRYVHILGANDMSTTAETNQNEQSP